MALRTIEANAGRAPLSHRASEEILGKRHTIALP